MSKISNRAFLEVCDDNTVQVEQIVYLAGFLSHYDGGRAPEQLEEFLESDVDAIQSAFFNKIPKYVMKCAEDDDDFNEALIQWMIDKDKLGFLVQLATPVMTHHGKSSSYSWGYRNLTWVYCDSLSKLSGHIVDWAVKMRADEKKSD